MAQKLSKTVTRMSDRPRRRRSPSRGRSESRGSPPLEYTETTKTITTRHKYATESECYRDYYQADFDQTVGTRSDALEYHDESDQDDWDPSNLCKLRKREIIDSIGQLAEPQSELHDLVKEYREVDEEEREYDSDDNSWGENSDDGEETDESEYDNEESETDHSESEDDDHDDDDKNHDEKEKN